MADQINTGNGRSGSTGLAVIVGALIIAVLVIGFFLFGGSVGESDRGGEVQTPGIGGSGETGGGTGGTGGGTGDTSGGTGGGAGQTQ